jgi:hypothetical protein
LFEDGCRRRRRRTKETKEGNFLIEMMSERKKVGWWRRTEQKW